MKKNYSNEQTTNLENISYNHIAGQKAFYVPINIASFVELVVGLVILIGIICGKFETTWLVTGITGCVGFLIIEITKLICSRDFQNQTLHLYDNKLVYEKPRRNGTTTTITVTELEEPKNRFTQYKLKGKIHSVCTKNGEEVFSEYLEELKIPKFFSFDFNEIEKHFNINCNQSEADKSLE